MNENLSESVLHHSALLHGGQAWSGIVRRGRLLTLTDLAGGANVSALFYNAENFLERYNMPDTLKAQHIARLSFGDCLYSDMGHVLCSVVQDTCGWHDTITGIADAKASAKKYGKGSYYELRNGYYRNTRDNFLTELAKYELGKRDIVANVNFFVKVSVDEEGSMSFVENHSLPGSLVKLRMEMDTLVVLSNTPHPMAPGNVYAPGEVSLVIHSAGPMLADQTCRHNCQESERAYQLNDLYYAR